VLWHSLSNFGKKAFFNENQHGSADPMYLAASNGVQEDQGPLEQYGKSSQKDRIPEKTP